MLGLSRMKDERLGFFFYAETSTQCPSKRSLLLHRNAPLGVSACWPAYTASRDPRPPRPGLVPFQDRWLNAFHILSQTFHFGLDEYLYLPTRTLALFLHHGCSHVAMNWSGLLSLRVISLLLRNEVMVLLREPRLNNEEMLVYFDSTWLADKLTISRKTMLNLLATVHWALLSWFPHYLEEYWITEGRVWRRRYNKGTGLAGNVDLGVHIPCYVIDSWIFGSF